MSKTKKPAEETKEVKTAKTEATKETPTATEEPKAEEKEVPVVPDVLKPTDVPEAIAEEKAKTARKVKPKYRQLGLKDFNSMRWRPAVKGDLNLLGEQVPEGDLVLCLRKDDVPVEDLKAMPVMYENEEIKNAEGEVIETRRIAFKKAAIRKSEKGVVVDGNRHHTYKQHTVIVAIENPEVEGEIRGHVGYWNTALTPDDEAYLKEKEEAKVQKAKEKEEAKAVKKAEKEAEAAKKAAEAAEAEAKKDEKATSEKEEPAKETSKEKVKA